MEPLRHLVFDVSQSVNAIMMSLAVKSTDMTIKMIHCLESPYCTIGVARGERVSAWRSNNSFLFMAGFQYALKGVSQIQLSS